jgi:hypothetical protein
MNWLKERWRLFRRWQADQMLTEIQVGMVIYDESAAEERRALYTKLVKRFGGKVVENGPCSQMRRRGASWVSFTWYRPDNLCSESELRARAAMDRMFAAIPLHRAPTELFEKKDIEYKPYGMPSTKLLEYLDPPDSEDK